MDRKLLLVFALTFLVIMLFQPLLKKYGPQPPAKPESSQSAQNQVQVPLAAAPHPPTQTPANAVTVNRAGAKGATAAAQKQAASEAETVIENDVYRIVFTNRGGRVKSWVLKKFTDDKGGQLELVNAAASEKYGYPLTLWTYDEGLRDKLNSALYATTSASPQNAKGGLPAAGNSLTAPVELSFAYSDGDLSVEKSFSFDPNSYVV